LDIPREVAERLSTKAIRQGKNLEAVVVDLLRTESGLRRYEKVSSFSLRPYRQAGYPSDNAGGVDEQQRDPVQRGIVRFKGALLVMRRGREPIGPIRVTTG
jgi:hypothetical protein